MIGTPLASAPCTNRETMRTPLAILSCLGLFGMAQAQFQVNPQFGINYQHLTGSAPEGTTYKAAMGWQLGADLRFGDRLYVQPGAFFGRSATMVQARPDGALLYEDDMVRTNLRMRAMFGYRIVDTYQFDLRFAMGPSYDVLLSVDDRHDRIAYDKGDFRNGSLNIDATLGFDMGYFTLEPGVSFGLSRVFSDNPAVKDLDARYLVYGVTIGVNLGNDD